MQAILLERRIQRELARPVGRLEPPTALGRAVPPLAAPDAGRDARRRCLRRTSGRTGPADCGSTSLERRRDELADEAFDRLAALELPSRAEACERIVQTAVDEVGETIAFLEDMPLDRAVKRLN